MSTNAITAMNQNMSSSAANTTTSASGSNTSAERNMFMTLLVAQLKNQDPLSPQDGTAFVAQLAQFNSLDQLVGIRQSIEQLTTLLQQPHVTSSTVD